MAAGRDILVAGRDILLFTSGDLPPRSGPLTFNLPRLIGHFQPRPVDLDALRDAVMRSPPSGLLALYGMGGVGKTVLATMLVLDDVARGFFTDGTAWLTFGRSAAPLAKAAELFEAVTGRPHSFSSADAARGHLGEATRGLALLIVLDDLWTADDLDPFTGLGPRCCVVVTARDAGITARSGADSHTVGLLAPSAARAFLLDAAGVLPDAPAPPETDGVIRHCGRLPLAMAAAGALIRAGTYSWADTLEALEAGAAEAFDTAWLPDPAQRNMAVVLRLSVDGLPPEEKACFLACAVLREDAALSPALLDRLWSGLIPAVWRRRRMAPELAKRSLLLREGEDCFRIHDLYMDLLRSLCGDLPRLHGEWLDRLREVCPAGWETYPDDGYTVGALPWHMQQAGRIRELRELLFHPSWLRRKLRVSGVPALLADCELLPDDAEVEQVRAVLVLSSFVLSHDPEQLDTHLHGRLQNSSGPTIARLVAELAPGLVLKPAQQPFLAQIGAELLRMHHGYEVQGLAVLPDGQSVLSGDDNGTMWLSDLRTGIGTGRFKGHTDPIYRIAVLPDGRRAITVSIDHTVRVWDLNAEAELRRLGGHKQMVTAIAVLSDGKLVLTGSPDLTIRQWDVDSGTEMWCLHDASADWITCLARLPGDARFLSADVKGVLRLWDRVGLTELSQVAFPSGISDLVVLPDGTRVLVGLWDGTLQLLTLEPMKPLMTFARHAARVTSVLALPDGHRVMSASFDASIRIWDVATGAEVARLEGHSGKVEGIALVPGGRLVVSASADRTVRLWDLAKAEPASTLSRHDFEIDAIAVLHDGRRCLSTAGDEAVRLWDLDTGTELRRFDKGTWLRLLAILPDGRRALVGRYNDVAVWDLETGEDLCLLKGPDDPVQSLAPLPDGRHVLVGGWHGTVRVWDTLTGAEVRCFKLHEHPDARGARDVGWVIALPGWLAASSGKEDVVRIWDVRTGTTIRTLPHPKVVEIAALLPDGRHLLTMAHDEVFRLWNLDSSDDPVCFGKGTWATSLAVLPDGRRALSAVWNEPTLRLWDLQTGTEVARFTGDHPFRRLAVTGTADGLVVGTSVGQVCLFSVGPIGDRSTC